MRKQQMAYDISFQLAWNEVRKRKEFRYADIEVAVGVSNRTARKFVKEWVAGKLVGFSHEVGRKKVFKVLRTEIHSPNRYDADGTLQVEQTVHGNLWKAIRSLTAFTVTDLVATSNTPNCEVSEKEAAEYCEALLAAGYLHQVRKAVRGRRSAAYRIARNTGPRAPQMTSIPAIFDGNVNEFTKIAGGQK